MTFGTVQGMGNLAKNLRDYMQLHELGEEAAAKALGIHQSTLNRLINPGSSKPIRNPSQATLQKIADALEVTVDAVVRRDLSISAHSVDTTEMPIRSHPAKLDLARLGIALTAIDKALAGVEIQGKLGTLAEAIQFAYARAFSVSDVDNQAQRALFDELVAVKIGGGRVERGGIAARGPREDRKAAPQKSNAGGRR